MAEGCRWRPTVALSSDASKARLVLSSPASWTHSWICSTTTVPTATTPDGASAPPAYPRRIGPRSPRGRRPRTTVVAAPRPSPSSPGGTTSPTRSRWPANGRGATAHRRESPATTSPYCPRRGPETDTTAVTGSGSAMAPAAVTTPCTPPPAAPTGAPPRPQTDHGLRPAPGPGTTHRRKPSGDVRAARSHRAADHRRPPAVPRPNRGRPRGAHGCVRVSGTHDLLQQVLAA